MKKSIFLLVVILSAFFATAQEKKVVIGNGHLTKVTRNVGGYNSLLLQGPFTVKLVTGNDTKITVEADRNIIDFVVTEVKNGELIIKPMEGKLFKSSGSHFITVKVPSGKLNAISLQGSGKIVSKKPLNNDVKLDLAGSGSIELAAADNKEAIVHTTSNSVKLAGTENN
jgi:hypothetical protein